MTTASTLISGDTETIWAAMEADRLQNVISQ